ncbi:MAG TPA: GntR family transcriptional regulator [Arachnia sp.]|nr:GntR family transcriptional regulator [Arachnia sp.]HMT86697.1 GntR family transcriptional regulator [Arachnia sp.]
MKFDTERPIWLQLVAEFERRILIGEWPSGEKVPGVRDLAVELGVNPNTVQRAFAELERGEMVRTERTTGRFVTDQPGRIDDLRRSAGAEAADGYVREAQRLGMSKQSAIDLLGRRWEETEGQG